MRRQKEAVAKGGKAAIEALVASLSGDGIPAESRDSGPVHTAWVDRERAERARAIVENVRGVHLVSGLQSAYELCFTCGYEHGPGATYCKRCGEYVRA